jgi:hypothetical protein
MGKHPTAITLNNVPNVRPESTIMDGNVNKLHELMAPSTVVSCFRKRRKGNDIIEYLTYTFYEHMAQGEDWTS